MSTHPALRALAVAALLSAACKTREAPPGATEPAPALAPNGGANPTIVDNADGEVAAIVATVDSGEVEEGTLARTRAQDPRVRAFGESMVAMHGESTAKLGALRLRTGITPRESERSRTLAAEGAATKRRLEALQGADFDRAYVDAQATEHARVLDLIDTALLPMARNPELRTALTDEVRPMVADHLRRARELQSALAAVPAGPAAPGDGAPSGAAAPMGHAH